MPQGFAPKLPPFHTWSTAYSCTTAGAMESGGSTGGRGGQVSPIRYHPQYQCLPAQYQCRADAPAPTASPHSDAFRAVLSPQNPLPFPAYLSPLYRPHIASQWVWEAFRWGAPFPTPLALKPLLDKGFKKSEKIFEIDLTGATPLWEIVNGGAFRRSAP